MSIRPQTLQTWNNWPWKYGNLCYNFSKNRLWGLERHFPPYFTREQKWWFWHDCKQNHATPSKLGAQFWISPQSYLRIYFQIFYYLRPFFWWHIVENYTCEQQTWKMKIQSWNIASREGDTVRDVIFAGCFLSQHDANPTRVKKNVMLNLSIDPTQRLTFLFHVEVLLLHFITMQKFLGSFIQLWAQIHHLLQRQDILFQVFWYLGVWPVGHGLKDIYLLIHYFLGICGQNCLPQVELHLVIPAVHEAVMLSLGWMISFASKACFFSQELDLWFYVITQHSEECLLWRVEVVHFGLCWGDLCSESGLFQQLLLIFSAGTLIHLLSFFFFPFSFFFPQFFLL